jgi:hypothetical protein
MKTSEGRPVEVLRYAAFTVDGSGGNPAGLVLDAAGVDAATMLGIAAEVGFSETVFLGDRSVDAAGRTLMATRYFSPLALQPVRAVGVGAVAQPSELERPAAVQEVEVARSVARHAPDHDGAH